MGSCVSLSVHSKSSPRSTMKGRMSFTAADAAIPASPIRDKNDAFDQNPVNSQSLSSADSGSKDDMFFDCQPWLESDGEEDFVSVNGDSIPTSGNTPTDQNTSKGAMDQVNSPVAWIHEPSVKEKRKKLGDLLKEGLKEDQSEEQEDILGTNQKQAIAEVDRDQYQPPKLAGTFGTSSASGTGKLFCGSTDRRTANGDILMNKAKTAQGCFTGLVSCRSFSERKRRLSPAIGVTDKA